MENRAIIIDRILRGDYVDMEGGKWESVSQDGKAFVRSLLETDPNKRPSADEALRFPWMLDCNAEEF
jgi:serine/threonine protein kinase